MRLSCATVALTLAATGVAAPLLFNGVASAAAGDIYNCDHFASQAAAQTYFRQDPSDPSRLDADNDGIACESNPAPYDRTPAQATGGGGPTSGPSSTPSNGTQMQQTQMQQVPVGAPGTGGGSTAGIEDIGLLLAGGFALAGAGTIVIVRRRLTN